MVSVLIKSIENIVLFAKTHHLKTLYIMAKAVEGVAAGFPSQFSDPFLKNTVKRSFCDM